MLTPRDEQNIERLMGPGAKLLSGPRGSGKSTLLRIAYFRLITQRQCLAVYVNYAKSLALEPLFHRQSNALQIFRQWLLMKIVLGLVETLKVLSISAPSDLVSLGVYAANLVDRLAVGDVPDSFETTISPASLVEKIEAWASALGLKRSVLLLDDAAHAFSPEQQREFFEVFRELRTRRVAPKAAVYPGITSYSPFFHVGHEAETLEAWYRPDELGFLQCMRSIVDRRLPEPMRQQLSERSELIDFLALASFGLPRGFLNMISDLLTAAELTGKPTRQQAEHAVADNSESVRGIFSRSLGETSSIPELCVGRTRFGDCHR